MYNVDKFMLQRQMQEMWTDLMGNYSILDVSVVIRLRRREGVEAAPNEAAKCSVRKPISG